MTEILVSGGWGAGWSTWGDDDKAKQIAEYRPIIDFIKQGGDPLDLGDDHPLVKQMKEELGVSYFYTGGRDGLRVDTVDGPYMIDENDGFETVLTAEDFWT